MKQRLQVLIKLVLQAIESFGLVVFYILLLQFICFILLTLSPGKDQIFFFYYVLINKTLEFKDGIHCLFVFTMTLYLTIKLKTRQTCLAC